VLVYSLAL